MLRDHDANYLVSSKLLLFCLQRGRVSCVRKNETGENLTGEADCAMINMHRAQLSEVSIYQ